MWMNTLRRSKKFATFHERLFSVEWKQIQRRHRSRHHPNTQWIPSSRFRAAMSPACCNFLLRQSVASVFTCWRVWRTQFPLKLFSLWNWTFLKLTFFFFCSYSCFFVFTVRTFRIQTPYLDESYRFYASHVILCVVCSSSRRSNYERSSESSYCYRYTMLLLFFHPSVFVFRACMCVCVCGRVLAHAYLA